MSDMTKRFEFNFSFFEESEGVINSVYFIWMREVSLLSTIDSSKSQCFPEKLVTFNSHFTRSNDENESIMDKIQKGSSDILEFVLKVNTLGDAWKQAKTINEITLLEFLHKEKQSFEYIRVPRLFDYDLDGTTCDYEYLLMEKLSGVSMSLHSRIMDIDERKFWIEQIAHYLIEMKERVSSKIYVERIGLDTTHEENRQQFDLKFLENSKKETKWFGGSFLSLKHGNPAKEFDNRQKCIGVTLCPYVDSKKGPFDNYVDYLKSLIEFRIPIFERIENGRFKKYIPFMKKYIEKYLNDEFRERVEKENLSLFISHGDLSMSNVIICPKSKKITGIIDYEWARLSVIEEDYRTVLQDWCIGVTDLEHYFTSLLKPHLSNLYEEILKHFQFIDLLSNIENFRQFNVNDEKEAELSVVTVMEELDELCLRVL
ncbi:hypothetical protein FDP41_000926 [Naegleria fowleri]|uniref:Uncharacterized protein n=1 Tax=Naegleria fowleri TaxID=5763 RepID=A0A6A5BP27_NAEFO|nr:uncharacterized protein FDP41_000926 [Naegleria fowleri]KAF0979773.1 hypothetical protein FDP41_000926 [Naegleria fowleri]CAG4714089.1 unnamed protein product [Naegleria fowleri]